MPIEFFVDPNEILFESTNNLCLIKLWIMISFKNTLKNNSIQEKI